MGKSIDDVFTGRWLKATDLGDKTPVVTIKKVVLDTIEDEAKLIVFFEKVARGLVLNKTNANSIAEITGTRDYGDWNGYQIKLIKVKVEYQGKRVDGIRIEPAPKGKTNSKPKPEAEPFPEEEEATEITDDDVPF
jgi:hypothetical protein